MIVAPVTLTRVLCPASSTATWNTAPGWKCNEPFTLSIPDVAPGAAPGASVPSTVTELLIVPTPASVAPSATATEEFTEPFTVSVPSPTVDTPVNVLVPVSVRLPIPTFVKLPNPRIVPLNVPSTSCANVTAAVPGL